MTSWSELGNQLEMLYLTPLNSLGTLHHIDFIFMSFAGLFTCAI